METTAILPTTTPAIAPAFELLPFRGLGPAEDGPDWVPVELKDALAEDVDTPYVPTIAPRPYSGLSI
jgi:hypothetical protein